MVTGLCVHSTVRGKRNIPLPGPGDRAPCHMPCGPGHRTQAGRWAGLRRAATHRAGQRDTAGNHHGRNRGWACEDQGSCPQVRPVCPEILGTFQSVPFALLSPGWPHCPPTRPPILALAPPCHAAWCESRGFSGPPRPSTCERAGKQGPLGPSPPAAAAASLLWCRVAPCSSRTV